MAKCVKKVACEKSLENFIKHYFHANFIEIQYIERMTKEDISESR